MKFTCTFLALLLPTVLIFSNGPTVEAAPASSTKPQARGERFKPRSMVRTMQNQQRGQDDHDKLRRELQVGPTPAELAKQLAALLEQVKSKMDNAFGQLKTRPGPNAEPKDQKLSLRIPLLGASIDDIFGSGDDGLDETIATLLDFTSFTFNSDTSVDGGLTALLQSQLNDFFATRSDSVGGGTPSSGCASAQDFPIKATVSIGTAAPPEVPSWTIDIDICSEVSFAKPVTLETTDFLGTLKDGAGAPRNVALKSSAQIIPTAKLFVRSKIELSSAASTTITLGPINANLAVADDVDAELIVGVLGFSSSAAVDMNLGVTLTYSGASSYNLSVDSATSAVTGDLALVGIYKGLTFADPSFALQASGLLDNLFINLDITNIDIAFERFSPTNALNLLLRSVDSALVRSQENSVFMKTKLPFTDSSVATNLVTGSILTSKKSELFAGPEKFSLRAQKSVTLIAPSGFEQEENATVAASQLLDLYVVRDDLRANPNSPIEVRDLDKTSICSFKLPSVPSDNEDFANILVNEFTNTNCGIKACRFGGTCRLDADSGDISGCTDCDLVVDVDNDGGNLFIASNADDKNNVVLIGLFNRPSGDPNQVFAATTLFGFPLNQPANTKLVPRFSTFAEFVDKVREALNKYSNVIVDFRFATDGDGARRFELDVDFDYKKVTRGGWDTKGGIGDLGSIQVQAGADLTSTVDASFSSKYAVILAPNGADKISFFTKACDGTTFTCNLEPLIVQIDYVENGDRKVKVVDLPEKATSSSSAELQNALSDIATVTAQGDATLAVTLNEGISLVVIGVPKDCYSYSPDTGERNPTPEDPVNGVCLAEWEVVPIDNAYGLRDGTYSIQPFQIAVGEISISADVKVIGTTSNLTATIGNKIEVSADLGAEIYGSLDATIAHPDGFLRFREWLAFVTSVGSGFLELENSFGGEFDATISPLAPFDFSEALLFGAKGAFSDFVVDFSGSKNDNPVVTLEVVLPKIGLLPQIPYVDVMGCLSVGSILLAGEGTTATCTQGLLGDITIGGKNVFFEELPGLGVRLCDVVGVLGIFTNAIDTLRGDAEQTFNALTAKLENLLEDSVGGEPEVTVDATSFGDSSTLTMGIKLSWSLSETVKMGINLEDLFGDVDVDDLGILADILRDITPEAGGEVNLSGSLEFRFGFKVEFSSGVSSCFVLGDSGLDVEFPDVSLTTDFSGGLGPFQGQFSSKLGFSENLSLSVGFFNPSADFAITSLADIFGSLFSDSGIFKLPAVATWTGGITNYIEASVPLLGLDLDFKLDFPDLNAFLEFGPLIPGGNGDDPAIPSRGSLRFKINSIGDPLALISSLDLPSIDSLLFSGNQLDLFINAIDSLLGFVENAAFGGGGGGGGAVSGFELPFIKNSISVALGGGPGGLNIFSEIRSKVNVALQDGLSSLGDLGVLQLIVDGVKDLLQDVLGNNFGLLQEDKEIEAECFDSAAEPLGACDGGTHSILWKIPFGRKETSVIPIDFNLDEGNKLVELEINLPNPVLTVEWSLDLNVGFNKDAGIFLDTRPDEGCEVGITAQLSILDSGIKTRLLFLDAVLADLDFVLAAGIFIDANVETATRRRNLRRLSSSFQEGWMKLSQVASSLGSLFEVNADAVVQVSADATFGVTDFGGAEKLIPKLKSKVAAQARKTVGTGSASTIRNLSDGAAGRRLSTRMRDKATLASYSGHPDERIVQLMRSLSCETNIANAASGFGCSIEEGKSFCLGLLEVQLDTDAISELVSPIIEDVKSFIDPIGDPLLTLKDPIPGLSEVAGTPISILDMAETLVGDSSGVGSVRRFLEIYEAINDFTDNFADGDIYIADFCGPVNGTLKCKGGLFGDEFAEPGRRSRALDAEMEEVFQLVDRGGNPMSPVDTVHRSLAECNINAECVCEGTTAACKAITCKAKRAKCKAGLRFPFLEDPTSVVSLFTGGDVQLLEFTAPTIEFAFEASQGFVLYPAPTVLLEIGFEFSVVLEVTFVLDTKGIREAIQQNKPEKALNSFGLVDSVDGVDDPFIVLTGEVYLDVSVSAVIVKIGVRGGVGFRVTIDFFDPYPETSGGIVRPFELIALGSGPLQWFEFKLEIFLTISVYIKIGLFIGPFEITLWSYEYGDEIALITPLIYTPEGPCRLVKIGTDKRMQLEACAPSDEPLECTGLGGGVGDESIECVSGEFFKTVNDVASVKFTDDETFSLLWRDIQSPADFKGIILSSLELDYKRSSEDLIVISGGGARIGPTAIAYDTVTSGALILPKPERSFLTTSFESNCNSGWTLSGHSNVLVKANEVENCNIVAKGGESNDASVTIDFGLGDCEDGNKVEVDVNTNANTSVTLVKVIRGGTTFTVEAYPRYTAIVLKLSQCDDVVDLSATLETLRSVQIFGREGSDVVTVGSRSDGLDKIFANVIVKGGTGPEVESSDTLNIIDSGSRLAKEGKLRSSYLDGLFPRDDTDFVYSGFEIINLDLSFGVNTFTVASTARGSETTVKAGPENDSLTVITTQGNFNLYAGDGNDAIAVFGLGEDTLGVVYGEIGEDTLIVDGRTGAEGNLFDQTRLRWSGGDGHDELLVNFTSFGTSNLDIFDDNDGDNTLTIDCPDLSCSILSRENFIANIQDMEDDETSVERINIDKNSASIIRVLLRLNDGENQVFFDDTFAQMNVFGGPLKDEFRIGQLYNSERDSDSHVEVSDPIHTTLTTRGYLSNGNSFPLIINGEFGNDFFDVLRNLGTVDLNGNSGNDAFVIRSFVAVIRADGTLEGPGVEKVTALGGDNDDTFDIGAQEELFDDDESPVAYVINSLVDVDGGTGSDRAIIVGTEADDSFVVTGGEIFGCGRTIKYSNIESLDVVALEGNDIISVLSTGPELTTAISGNLGSDTIRITPRNVDPVISKNLRGHRGIVEHTVISEDDSSFDGLLLEGVAVNVMDNDVFGWINVVETEALHVLLEGTIETFSFFIYPTIAPNKDVTVTIVAQTDIDENSYFKLNGDTTGILTHTFKAEDMAPLEVIVGHNTGANPLRITDEVLTITTSLVVERTFDDRFKDLQQSLLPITARLLPRPDSVEAKSVAVVQPTGKTFVVEGEAGATYDVYLRPCNPAMKMLKVNIEPTIADQVIITPKKIMDWGAECKVTVTVEAVDDDPLEEGLHFVTLAHTLEGPPEILKLSDESALSASNVLVKIYDKQLADVIVDEPRLVTRTAELEDTDKTKIGDSSLYDDYYRIRLTKPPNGTVTVRMASTAVTTDTAAQLAAQGLTNYQPERLVSRGQILFENDAESIDIVFDSSDWDTWKRVNVYALNDGITEGADVLHFPSQPSYLSYIQGPLEVSGSTTGVFVPEIADPLMLPNEIENATFIPPDGAVIDLSALDAIEENQVDRLLVYNLDVRGDQPSVGTLTFDQLVGFNMGQGIAIAGIEQRDGLVYGNMEIVEIYLGNGVDIVTVLNTSEALHLLDLGDGNDGVVVKDISGPFVIQGGGGQDSLVVSSDQNKLDKINALCMFDGGDSVDSLTLDDSGEDLANDVLNVTRLLVELDSMNKPEETLLAPADSYLVSLRGATNGTFDLTLYDPINDRNAIVSVAYPVDLRALEDALKNELLMDGPKSCGTGGETKCSDVVQVYSLGDQLGLFFLGERLNSGVTMDLTTDGLLDYESEQFGDETNDILKKNSDFAYANVEKLTVSTGSFGKVINVRGTTADETEILASKGVDDFVFIASDANENVASAPIVDFLYGWLDYIEGDLTVAAGPGRNRLMISDEKSSIAKGSPTDRMTLQRDSLTQIKDILGDVFFTADNGDWSRGVNLWLGSNSDILTVLSIPSNTVEGVRTTTSVHAGEGNDNLQVALDESENVGSVFVANGQGGDDSINATSSSLSVILFGEDGVDYLDGGSGNDIVFGDFGRVYWRDYDQNASIVAISGGGGYGDLTDGRERNVSDIFSTSHGDGDGDEISLGDGDDVGIGGFGKDTIFAGADRDIVFGDSAEITYWPNTDDLYPKLLLSSACDIGDDDELHGGPGDVDYLIGGTRNDTIFGDDGVDLAFGDHARIELSDTVPFGLAYATTIFANCSGGDDIIDLGSGDDLAFGGAFDDTIYGQAGQDIIFGDFGFYNSNLPYPQYRSLIEFSDFSGGDTIHGGDSDDIIFGQEGADVIYGEMGSDDIIGGHNVLFGADEGDILDGGSGDDVFLGDNGFLTRRVKSIGSSYPFDHLIEWEKYPEPFPEVIRDVQRFDDVDLVAGDDTISGQEGNDILHGQRGIDILYGGPGEDELYGELGSDRLFGGDGDDILLGDIGYVIRRFESDNVTPTPLQTSKGVWSKDIILEEQGFITGAYPISTKVDVESVSAEDILSSSFVIAANGFDEDGTKTENTALGGWPTEILLMDLQPSDNDVLDGGAGDDTVIGQRGNDTLRGGDGNDLLIGDSGFNHIIYNMDLPRIYEVYRALPNDIDTGYIIPEFGVLFTIDYELYPAQYRYLDSLGSIIDLAVNMDDVQSKSNLLTDILGVSALTKAGQDYCMQPMFRITPGFLNPKQILHGNDSIESGPGENLVIGDSIRGGTGLDLSVLSEIDNVRTRMDDIIGDLAKRLSTIETDVQLSAKDTSAFDLCIGCDIITTDASGTTMLTGDSLTLFGRTLLGDEVDPATPAAVLERLHDIELVLVDLHFAFFELHTKVLRDHLGDPALTVDDQIFADRKLSVGNDIITVQGKGDVAIGDSSTIFIQSDRVGTAGFEFSGLDENTYRAALSGVSTRREAERDLHVETLDATPPLSNQEQSGLPFDDVPFTLSSGDDNFILNGEIERSVAVGDFALIGAVSSSSTPDGLEAYRESVESLRKRPVAGSVVPRTTVVGNIKLEFYENRYKQQISRIIEPSIHADIFEGNSILDNVVLGEFLTAIAYLDFATNFAFDDQANAFGQWTNGQVALEFSDDTFDLGGTNLIDGQKGQDIYLQGTKTNVNLDEDLTVFSKTFFTEHALVYQMRTDLFAGVLTPQQAFEFKAGFQCTGVVSNITSSFVDESGGPVENPLNDPPPEDAPPPEVIASIIPTAVPAEPACLGYFAKCAVNDDCCSSNCRGRCR